MVDRDTKYEIITWVSVVSALVVFAVYALVRYTLRLVRVKHDASAAEFITARGTQGAGRIMFSYFASAVGAWCLVSPSQFGVYTGILGLAMYAFASGIPVLIISIFGSRIQEAHPDVLSIADFAGKRFGPTFRCLVVLLCLFNMGIALLAEYTTISSLFRDFVDTLDYPIVIVVGVLTMAYTAYGGTYISILTDQLQAWLTLCFLGILTVYVAINFREPLPRPIPDGLGVTKNGYSAIFSLTCSLLAATVFSEAMWQKVWASSNRRAVVAGGLGGAVLITGAVFLFGFAGWLAAWGGLIDFETTDPNLFLFQIFKSDDSANAATGMPARVRSWVGVIAMVLAGTMNESAVDSLQSGLTGTVSSHFFRDQHVGFTRAVVLVLNIPLMVVSLQGYPILSLFLISNMVTTCCFLPVLSGVFSTTHKWVTESSALFGFATAILTVCAYGAGRWWNETETFLQEPITSRGQAFRYGIYYAWYGNVNYDWDYFLVASGSSVVGMALWGLVAAALRATTGRKGVSISRLLCFLPACGFVRGDGLGFDLLAALTCGRWRTEGWGAGPVVSPGLELGYAPSQDGGGYVPHKEALAKPMIYAPEPQDLADHDARPSAPPAPSHAP